MYIMKGIGLYFFTIAVIFLEFLDYFCFLKR